MIVTGLKTCDTCRKALKALEAAGHEVTFRDVRQDPLTPADIETLLSRFGERAVNRASTTWRGLSEAERAAPLAVLLESHPALMKRPWVVMGDQQSLGWDKAAQALWL